jgi:hypothetical protein
MNTYLLSFFLRHESGEIRGATQLVAATCASMAILQLHALPLPGVIVGAITWSLTGPRVSPPRHALAA